MAIVWFIIPACDHGSKRREILHHSRHHLQESCCFFKLLCRRCSAYKTPREQQSHRGPRLLGSISLTLRFVSGSRGGCAGARCYLLATFEQWSLQSSGTGNPVGKVSVMYVTSDGREESLAKDWNVVPRKRGICTLAAHTSC